MDVKNQILINLLPQEIIDKRKAEKRIILALLVAAAIGMILFGVFSINMIRLSAQEDKITRLENENAKHQVAIDEIRIFQEKQGQVKQLESLIASVSGLRFVWSKFFNDISLIMPNDIWLTKLSSDSKVVSFDGLVQGNTTGTTDLGHKPVAKWLVHLGQIEGLSDIWLTTTNKVSDKDNGKIKFSTTAKIKQPKSEITAPVVSAPPPSGQAVEGGS